MIATPAAIRPAGREDPAVLVRAVAEHPVVVAVRGLQREQPDDRQDRQDHVVGHVDADDRGGVEAPDVTGQDGERDHGRVDHHEGTDVAVLPEAERGHRGVLPGVARLRPGRRR
ncbi:hypothetical protein JCM9533A_38260 [Catenuloplanes niger JCM 9533]